MHVFHKIMQNCIMQALQKAKEEEATGAGPARLLRQHALSRECVKMMMEEMQLLSHILKCVCRKNGTMNAFSALGEGVVTLQSGESFTVQASLATCWRPEMQK